MAVQPISIPPLAERMAGALSVDDWFTMPDDGQQYELLEGVLCLVTPPSRRHQDVLGEIFFALKSYTRAHGGYAGIAPLGIALAERIGFEPDAVYVSAGREALLSERGIEGVPDLVVEVLSRSTSAFDRGTKLRLYLEHGVREVWLVDLERNETMLFWQGGESLRVPFGAPIPSRIAAIGDGGLTAEA